MQQLYAAISSSDQSTTILDEQAPWAVTFSEQPPQPPAPVGGLDPRGSEDPLRQERSPLGLTHPPGGQTEDHETDL